MADFIAVIRRAVDGLTENTPEMRVKVYERARGAVQRQLENMKPRPPETMLLRQLDKLEAAIREVEAEHSEALPDEGAAVDTSVAPEAPPESDTPPEPVHEAVPEPAAEPEALVEEPVAETHVEAQAEPEVPDYEEPAAVYEEPVAAQAEEPAHEEPVHEEASWHPPVEEAAPPEELPAASPAEAVEEGHYAPAEEPVAEVHAEPAHEPEPPVQPARDYDLANRLVEPFPAFEKPPEEFVEHSREEPLHADAAGHFDPVWAEPVAQTPAPPPKEAETDWALEELKQFSEAAPVATSADAAARAFEEVIAGIENPPSSAKMPAVNEGFSWEAAAFDDLPPIEAGTGKKTPVSAHFDDSDLFTEIHGKPAAKVADTPGEGWEEARPLRGYDRRGVVAEDDDGITPADLDQIVASKLQGKNFRMEPKRRRFGISSIISILVVLAVLGGGAYAAWMNRGELTAMVNGLVSSAAPSQTAKNEAKPATPGATAPAAQTPATPSTGNAAVQKPAEANRQIASLNDGTSASDKFTQRLLADGTEVDNGAAAIPGAPTAEGKSVAQQNVASAEPAPSAQAPAVPAGPGAAAPADTLTPTGAATAAPAPQATPVGSTEKMFLYEERIGQSSPTAIQGSVVWSVQHEAGQDGRQEATVQGNVSVPERNLSALVTFKRNSDPSLPASHIVEIVFSLPPNFEGGSIDSVQRISMKRTEQDRGDALIAVPAKITDDFHMIALNDYPDARKANLDLLSTRDWIDIPVTYRNGRRALLTMQKGSTGGQSFNTAIKEWSAFGDVSTSQ
jgi:hypothetical protein